MNHADHVGLIRAGLRPRGERVPAGRAADGRAEIAAWTAALGVLHSRPHGGDREE
jgi:hypothetical protein